MLNKLIQMWLKLELNLKTLGCACKGAAFSFVVDLSGGQPSHFSDLDSSFAL